MRKIINTKKSEDPKPEDQKAVLGLLTFLVLLTCFFLTWPVLAQENLATTPDEMTTTEDITTVSEIENLPNDEIPGAFYFQYKGSNNNFTFDGQSLLNKKYFTYNYNRLRSDIDTGWANTITLKAIVDLENYWGESYLRSPEYLLSKDIAFNMPLEPYHYIISGNTTTLRSYLYRAYATVYLPASTLTVGYQRIPFGVGRIWNPTDILNPPNPISVEPGERLGVYGAEYVYNLGNLSQAHAFLTLDVNNQTKDYGYRLKSNFLGCDAALSAIRNNDLRVSGLELERELLDTGIELRTEAGYFENRILDKNYYKYIFGLDYAFKNSLYLLVEYLVNENGKTDKYDYDLNVFAVNRWDQLAKRYAGLLASYELTPLIYLSASSITNLEDGSYFIGPQMKWSLADNADLSIGANFFCGSQYSEFWYYKDIYYFNYGVYF